jgi:hypothetical protein
MGRPTHGIATIAAHKGSGVVNDTSAATFEASLIELSADAVVTSLKYVGSDDDVKADHISTPGNAIGGNGATITPFGNNTFSSITLSAGTANWAK